MEYNSRFMETYLELGMALKTIDASVDPQTLFHEVFRGIIYLEGTGLDASQQAAVLATTNNKYEIDLVMDAVLQQWTSGRLFAKDAVHRRSAHGASAEDGWDTEDDWTWQGWSGWFGS